MKGISAAGEGNEGALGWALGTVGWEGEVRENRPKQGWWASAFWKEDPRMGESDRSLTKILWTCSAR